MPIYVDSPEYSGEQNQNGNASELRSTAGVAGLTRKVQKTSTANAVAQVRLGSAVPSEAVKNGVRLESDPKSVPVAATSPAEGKAHESCTRAEI